ncbi:MAG: pentapeptide repeat-containing protein [Rhodobacterales bacterium]
MSTPLKDPNKPAHAIVKVHDDGSALRNDGEVLQAANSNPWYVLATVFGEQAEGAEIWKYNKELAAKNRRAWNGWACAGLSEVERQDRAEKVGLAVEDLKPLTKAELDEIKTRFQKRMGKMATLPDRIEKIAFFFIYFSQYLCFEKYVFEKYANFSSSTFNGAANFSSSTFCGIANFDSSTFSGEANFSSSTFNTTATFISSRFNGVANLSLSTFSNVVYFDSSTFRYTAYFDSSRFCEGAGFSSSTFSGGTNFRLSTFGGNATFISSVFSGSADFSSAKFKSTTLFTNAKFISAVPQFHGADMYDDTVFSLPENYLDNWPPLSDQVTVEGQEKPINVMPAADQKRAYNRLRLFMNRALQFDEEQFFHRQEMRCKQEEAKGVHVVIFMLFDALSDYGNSIERPAAWLFILWIWGAIAKLNAVGGGSFWPDYHSIPHALGWSLSNLFTVFGFWRLYAKEFLELNSWLQLIGSAQTVCGFALLFLLGLGLRNRFRLR